MINVEITFMYERHALADGLVKGLKSFYYILNNLFKQTTTPKGGAHTNLYGLTRNVLARMRSTRDPFSVSRFIWNELQDVMDDARRRLPYAPYVMFMIERVTDYVFPKDVTHEAHRGEKTHPTQERGTQSKKGAATSRARQEPKSSHSASQRQ